MNKSQFSFTPLFNRAGLSLTETLVSLGLLGGVTLGVVNIVQQSEKRKSSMDMVVTNLSLEKQLESYLYSPRGCDVLKDKKIGDSLNLDIGKVSYRQGSQIGKTTIEDLKIEKFYKTDQVGSRGMAQVILTMSRKDNNANKRDIKEIPVPVNVKASGTSLIIEDCLLNKSKTFEEIIKRVCEGAFGPMTKNLTCTEAIALVEKRLIEEVCKEVYGEKTPQFNGDSCNLKLIHAGQSCGQDGKIKGFDQQGNIICG